MSITLEGITRNYDDEQAGELMRFTDTTLIQMLLELGPVFTDQFAVIHDEIGTSFYHRITVISTSGSMLFQAQETGRGNWFVMFNYIEAWSPLYMELASMCMK